jgi:hypothetical protein
MMISRTVSVDDTLLRVQYVSVEYGCATRINTE